ncbi:Triosephosphate isomerase [Andreprevotia sp. IGB-42]|uniref:triose-phosphate isomerase n=1 Tax=Andreprevotia sp. IGB-42 TaxID=2497473 RepID=UPI0013580A07|nr:triose-phosphate isomerase [Andreprevotia sp. IGB-42]KAF0812593.1 Triosephosphate isomerase [Andreprevotia sp. IGB-42]
MARQLVIGNWKMHGSVGQIRTVLPELVRAGLGANVAICVAYPYLALAKTLLAESDIQLGAQDVCEFHIGAYTGEVSPAMLADVGCEMVIIGHSERRRYFNETSEMAARKVKAALDGGLLPVYCVGETLAQRDAGVARDVIAEELQVLAGVPTSLYAVAYEPSWAVGTGVIATPEQIAEMHAFIKQTLDVRTRVLYGGSVKADNAAQVLATEGVDGVLVGGAALSATEFLKISSQAR